MSNEVEDLKHDITNLLASVTTAEAEVDRLTKENVALAARPDIRAALTLERIEEMLANRFNPNHTLRHHIANRAKDGKTEL